MADEGTTQELETLLECLRSNRGFDFTGYKRSGLGRRITKRMQTVGVATFSDYQDYLEVDPTEFAELFDTILINVTGFFRDEDPWGYLRDEVVPALAAEKHEDEPIRVWSAGCASGQEAYSLIMTMIEAIGADRVRERVKIYATDVDEDALERARQAKYSPREVQGVRPDLLSRYFEQVRGEYVVDPELRRSVIFGRHNLTKDAPISRIDLLVCRNTLMYLNAETQENVLDRLHFALRDGGVLLLGKAEMLLSHASLFTPIDLQRRMFRKVTKPTMRDRLLVMAAMYTGRNADRGRLADRLPLVAFQAGPDAQLVSTNEELETMNEELQSTNEELQTINDELSQRTNELNEVNAYLESILASFRGGVVVLDQDLRVRVWNHLSEELWGVRSDEAQGQYFLNLDIGLPVREMRTLLQAALSGKEQPLEKVVDAVNRRGRAPRMRVTCNALRGSDSEIRGVFVLMEEQPPDALSTDGGISVRAVDRGEGVASATGEAP